MNDNNADPQTDFQRIYAQTLAIYSVQGFSILAIGVVGWFVKTSTPNAVDQGPFTSIWVLILFIAVGAIVIRRVLTRWERLRDIKLLRGMKGLLGTLRTNSIILVTLAEVVMIAGFVSAFIRGDRGDLIRALIIAVVVYVICFPRRPVWETIVASLESVERS